MSQLNDKIVDGSGREKALGNLSVASEWHVAGWMVNRYGNYIWTDHIEIIW